ncbi:MAG: DUF998 domain-containing protein [Anaerolineaceae bacterium]
MSKINLLKLATWAGIISPALFVAVFMIEGWLRPGYDPLSTFISALSLGPRGWIQIINFIVFGALLLLFTRAVAAEFTSRKASKAGLILLTIIAFCFLLSGIFVMDPTGTPPDQATFHGTLHGIFGGVVFLLMPICILLFLRNFKAEPKWRSLWRWTFILGIFDAVAVLFFTLASKLPALQILFNDWIGLIQRTALIPFMIWVFIFALRILKRSKQG